jgi:hypothetical protein
MSADVAVPANSPAINSSICRRRAADMGANGKASSLPA